MNRIASNTVVHHNQPDHGPTRKHFVMILFALVISVLAAMFEDKTAAEERRKQREIAIQQAFSQALDITVGCLATGLNVLLQHVSLFVQAAGIQDGLPINTVTPESIIIVAQWILLLLICYGVIAGAFFLLTVFLKWLWWMLKVTVALACFGQILKDHSVGMETVTFRLACLGCVCIVLSIRTWRDQRIVHLEEQVKNTKK